MTIKQQLNGGPADWIIRGFVLLALGWFINELTYMRARIAILEEQSQQINATRFTSEEGDALRNDLLELERLLQTKIDARDAEENVATIRREILDWQERIDTRLRAVETR